jgi:thiol-disulfide isomerase/thioredoxin
MPSLEGATQWFNATEAHAQSESAGRPTLIHFWAVSCGICKENMPRVNEWRDARREEGLRVIAIHMPRYEADTNIEDVREAIAKYNITEPCAIDNMHKLRETFKNDQGYVPAYYLFDAAGKLRGFAAGEHGLDVLASALERVMAAAQKETREATA